MSTVEHSTKFINSLFVKDLLESHFRHTEVVVKKHTIAAVSANVHRLTIGYVSTHDRDETSMELLVLVRPTHQADNDAEKEWQLLEKILPEFVDILGHVEPNVQFSPKIVYLMTRTIPDVMILEDGSSFGFSRSIRPEGLDLKHSLVAIEKLAVFHAASVVHLNKSTAVSREQFNHADFLANSGDGHNFFRDALAAFIANAESMKIPGSMVKKLKALQPRLLAKSAEDYAASLNGFNVLNHGNVWSDNIFFEYSDDTKAPKRALLVDYKNAFIGSPVIDLMFFITTSVAYDVQRSSKDELIYAYHTKLSETLDALEYTGNVPTLLELHLDFLKRGIFELMLVLTVAPYLRSNDCAIQPKLVQPFFNESSVEVDVNAIAKQVLATHAGDIIEELDVVQNNGLLDWGVETSPIKRLLLSFQ